MKIVSSIFCFCSRRYFSDSSWTSSACSLTHFSRLSLSVYSYNAPYIKFQTKHGTYAIVNGDVKDLPGDVQRMASSNAIFWYRCRSVSNCWSAFNSAMSIWEFIKSFIACVFELCSINWFSKSDIIASSFSYPKCILDKRFCNIFRLYNRSSGKKFFM